MFNPNPRIQALSITPRHACYVIDDALVDPGRWVDYAAAHAAGFVASPHNAYPGPELRMPDEISAQLDSFFTLHIRRLLGARRTLRMYSRLALATTPPERLEPRQWLCHRDRMDVPGDRCIGACVLYLFDDPALGGTNFFVPRRPPAEIDLLVHESGTLAPGDFSRKYGIAPGYMTGSNAWFDKALTVPARRNRLVFYDGSLFHCGDLTAPERFDPDPRRGRLTLNGFFICRRSLATV